MSTTDILGFTELTSAAANKFVLVNQNNRRIEATTVRVLDRDLTTSPVSPSNGDTYILAGTGGDWSSASVNDIAYYYLGTWKFYTPSEGWSVRVNDEDIRVNFDGSDWVAEAAGDVGLSDLTDNSVPFVSGDTLVEDVNFNYDPDTDTLTVPNLTVTSNLTSIQTTNLEVSDAIISLAEGNATDSLDIGFIGERSTSNIFLGYDESADEFAFATTSSTSSDSTVTITDYSSIHAGGAIFDDNVLIGSTTDNGDKLQVTGDLSVNTGTITATDSGVSSDVVSIQNAGDPWYSLYRSTSNPLAGIGGYKFYANDAGGTKREFAVLQGIVNDNTTGNPKGAIYYRVGPSRDTVMRFLPTALELEVPLLSSNGTVSLPSHSFVSDPDTGMYRVASNVLGFATGGVQRLLCSSTAMQVNTPIFNTDGTAASPSLTFTNDTDTGAYRVGANSYGIATGGVNALTIDSSQNTLVKKIVAGETLASPIYPMTVYDSTNNSYIHFVNSTTGTLFSDGAQIGVPAGQSYLLINQREDSYIQFNTNATQAVTITSSQQVGMGTSVPVRKVHIDSGADSTNYLHFSNDNSGALSSQGADIGYFDSGAANPQLLLINRETDGEIRLNAVGSSGFQSFYTNNTLALTIDSSQNSTFGSAGSSATNRVNILGGGLNISNGAGNNDLTLTGNQGNIYARFYELGVTDPGTFELLESGSTIVKITASGDSYFNGGNLGIGTSSPASKMDVRNTDGKEALITGNDGSSNGFTLLGSRLSDTETVGNLGISHSGAGVVLSRFCKVSDAADDVYFSSYGAGATIRSAFKLDDDGSFIWLNAASATVAVDSIVTMTERMKVSNPAAGETSLWLYDADNATLERVTVGAADSGGSGFKVLRIPN
ncbi:MAG: putative ribonuclease III [Prokaryotic dsDNA virus sp.]|nr:MAG: putative ribonuclease III [Prokaryotic dsDNA virus sp.]|tara:strand:+ start:27850 stop:30495 length:2646 start_codon:yes stop_codon:yes gene_type:complete